MNKRYDVQSCALNLSNFANDDGESSDMMPGLQCMRFSSLLDYRHCLFLHSDIVIFSLCS